MFLPEIRFCGAGDIPEILRINAASEHPWPASVIEDDFSESSSSPLSYLGAFSNASPASMLGYAVFGHDMNSADDAGGHIGGMYARQSCALLFALVVDARCRRRGIGSQLLSSAVDCASYLGFRKMRLRVRSSNTPAISLYNGAGFAYEGTVQAYYSDGEDAIVMSAVVAGGG